MLLSTDSILGSLGLIAVGGDVTPPAAPEAKCIWPLLLKGIDPMTAPGEPDTTFAETTKDLLAR